MGNIKKVLNRGKHAVFPHSSTPSATTAKRLHLYNILAWQTGARHFVKDDGSPMSPDGITAWLGDFSKRHNLPHINPHAFRHTMASVLISSGKDVVSVSKRLGHAKVSTTTDIYSHIIAEIDEQNSECLADVLLRPANQKKSKVSG